MYFQLTLDEIVPKSVWELDKHTMQDYKEEASKLSNVRPELRAIVLDDRLQVHPEDTAKWFYLRDKGIEPDGIFVTLEVKKDTPLNNIKGIEVLYNKNFQEVKEIPVL